MQLTELCLSEIANFGSGYILHTALGIRNLAYQVADLQGNY